MATQEAPLLALTMTASGAVSARRLVGYDGAQATVQGQKVVGSAAYDAADGDHFAVNAKGTAIIEIGAAVSVGDELIVDADGKAIPSTGALSVGAGATPVTSSAANGAILTGATLPEHVFADALEAGAADGDLIEVLMR